MTDAYYHMTCTPSTVPPVLDIRLALFSVLLQVLIRFLSSCIRMKKAVCLVYSRLNWGV